MSIRRRKKTKQFTQIDNAALRNPQLSLKAKGLLAVMMSCPEDWQFYMDWLQQQSSDGRESHQTAMRELEAHGYVLREKIQGKGGKFSGWEYLVDDEPQTPPTATGEPTNGKAVSRSATDERETRLTGNPTDGKPAATNTDFTKTDLHKEKEVAIDVTGDAREATLERDDEGSSEEMDQAQLETARVFGIQAADLPGEEPHAEDLPSRDSEDELEGGNGEDQATDLKEVPGARDEIHELQPWNQADVNAQLDVLTNRRWLKPWQFRGQPGTQRALIDEVDGTGVDRREIARHISPERLEELVREVRKERARLEAESRIDQTVTVPSFQHLLIQELQSQVLRIANLRELVAAAAAEQAEEARPLDDDGEAPPPAPLTLQRPGQRRAWQVGDRVSYRRDVYEIVRITDRKIILDSETCGGVDIIRATDEINALRLISAARPAEVSA